MIYAKLHTRINKSEFKIFGFSEKFHGNHTDGPRRQTKYIKCCFSLFSNDILSYILGNVRMDANCVTRNVTPYMKFGGSPPVFSCTPGGMSWRVPGNCSRHNTVLTLSTKLPDNPSNVLHDVKTSNMWKVLAPYCIIMSPGASYAVRHFTFYHYKF